MMLLGVLFQHSRYTYGVDRGAHRSHGKVSLTVSALIVFHAVVDLIRPLRYLYNVYFWVRSMLPIDHVRPALSPRHDM